MNRLALCILPAALALAAPLAAQTPDKIECPATVAHGCAAEKCQNIGQIPTFRIDVAGKKVCFGMAGAPCTSWIAADIFQGSGGSITVGLAEQRLIMWIDDMKLKGARLSRQGVAAFFGDCKAM